MSFGIAIVAIIGVNHSGAFSRTPPAPANATEKILVKFKQDVSYERAQQIIEAEACTVDRILETSRIYLVRFPIGRSVTDAVDGFLTYPEVLYAEPDFKVEKLKR